MNEKPLCIEAKKAHAEHLVWFDDTNQAHIVFEGKERVVGPAHQYNLIEATLFGLNERLTMSSTSPLLDESGKTLRDFFNEEWETYNEALMNSNGVTVDYGFYVYYPEKNDLTLYAPPFWHKVVSVASSSKLLSDPEHKLSWREIREVLENTTVAVAGCSVGSNVAHLVAMDLRPQHLKLADKSLYKMENINRVRISYSDIVKTNAERGGNLSLPLQNKAEATAKQIYSMDPFINIFVYPEGIHEANIEKFLEGEGEEPRVDVLVEEVDDPKIKIFLRQEARKRKIPLVMVTDIGSCVQLDILRYDLNPELSLTYGASDETLIQAMNKVYDDPGNKKVFFDFVDTLIGTEYRSDELLEIMEGRCEIPTSTIIPQLGSTAAMAGAIAAETIARMRLGQQYPPRMIFNKKTFAVKRFD